MSINLHEIFKAEGEALAEAVRSTLSTPPGGDHCAPWRRSDELAGSVSTQADETGFVVGSTLKIALYQELGTTNMPPRPFLATTASSLADRTVRAVGEAAATTIAQLFRRG